MGEEIKTEGRHIVINGGNPLKGCPESFTEANAWADNANVDSLEFTPQWGFDCGFKLDFDGPILGVTSRFYPPTEFYGHFWDGTVTVLLMGKEIKEKKIIAKTLDELKVKVDNYVKEIVSSLGSLVDQMKDSSNE